MASADIRFSQLSLKETIAVLRACQMGIFNSEELVRVLKLRGQDIKGLIPVDDLYTKLKKALPNFNSTPAPTPA